MRLAWPTFLRAASRCGRLPLAACDFACGFSWAFLAGCALWLVRAIAAVEQVASKATVRKQDSDR
jgi:hypothetical protein